MVKKLSKHGNSLALVIDKAILELLKIDADTPLEVTTDGNKLIIFPVLSGRTATQAEFEEAMRNSLERHGPMYERLAKFDKAVKFVFENYDEALRAFAESERADLASLPGEEGEKE